MHGRLTNGQRRRLRRFRGLLRCEWCGRYGEVVPGFRWSNYTFGEWVEFASRHRIWLCHRDKCRHLRAGLVDERYATVSIDD